MKPIILQGRKEPQVKKLVRKSLLICGILSSLLYVGTDILASNLWEGYNWTSQAFSELNAIGAPNRSLVLLLLTIYGILLFAFGLGVYVSGNQKCILRYTGIFFVINATIGLSIPFFPMHIRGEGTPSDIMHIVLTGVTVLLIFLALGFGATAHRTWFCFYSIMTILIILVFGVLAGMDGPRIATNLPTPWLGVKERINIYSYQLWVAMLSMVLLLTKKGSNSINATK